MSRQSQAGLIAVLVLAIGLPAMAIIWRPPTSQPASSTTPLASTVAEVPTPTPTSPLRTPFPSSSLPSPTPTPGPSDCDVLPTSLAIPTDPIATPIVAPRTATLLFASALYARDPVDHTLYARDRVDDWATGLWFAPLGSDAPRLLATAEAGSVLPLALSPAGDKAIVWWIAERRPQGIAPCQSGIYVVATDGSGSVLLLGGDWSTAPGEQVQPTWTDPQQHDAPARSYYLPQVSFSPDGDHLAVVTNTTIDLGTTAGLDGASHHVGACPRWAWSAGDGSAFVAGCDQLTTAWYVDVANGPITGQSVALPQPNLDIAVPGWESIGAGSIGIDGDGQIVVARFYGLPVGCEDNPCQIPSPAWTVSTIDPAGGKTTSRGAVSDFLVGSEVLDHGLLAPHGDWLYADIDGGRARTIRLSDGTVTKTSSIGRIAGASRDGSLLYGSLPDDATGHVRVISIDALGGRHLVATIEWPAGGVAGALAIGVFGLVAG